MDIQLTLKAKRIVTLTVGKLVENNLLEILTINLIH